MTKATADAWDSSVGVSSAGKHWIFYDGRLFCHAFIGKFILLGTPEKLPFNACWNNSLTMTVIIKTSKMAYTFELRWQVITYQRQKNTTCLWQYFPYPSDCCTPGSIKLIYPIINTEPNKGMQCVLNKTCSTTLLNNLNFDIITLSFLWKYENNPLQQHSGLYRTLPRFLFLKRPLSILFFFLSL